MLRSFANAAWTGAQGENAFPDGTHFGCNFPEEDAGELPEMRLEVDTAGKDDLTGVRRKRDAAVPLDRAK